MKTTVKMVRDAWNVQIERTDKLLNELSDSQVMQEVAPGRNTGLYLFAHLLAVHDGMVSLISDQKELYPELRAAFISESDKKQYPELSVADLRAKWNEVHTTLNKRMDTISDEEWFQRHNSVTSEAFASEPHRNKLNIIINRTNHLAYHLGQLNFLKQK